MNETTLISFEEEVLRPILTTLANLTTQIESKFEKPVAKKLSNKDVWRYENPKLEHVIIQRLYRVISGLRTCYILLRYGHTQEIGVILRTVTEFQYDIVFLLENYGHQEASQHQRKFLDEVLKEAYKNVDIPFLGATDREMLPRKKVLASVARSLKEAENTSDAQKLAELDTDIFSGYVHGAYPNVMDMYGHDPTNIGYHPFGVKAGYINSTWSTQILIYLERAINKTIFVSHYFGLEEVKAKAFQLKNEFSNKAEKYGYSLEFEAKNPMENLKKGKPLG